MSATDMQVGGNHYKNMKIQPINYIQANEPGVFALAMLLSTCRVINPRTALRT